MKYTAPLSDYDIQALIDNELDWERAKIVMAHIDTDPTLKKRHTLLLAQKHLLQNWWQAQARH